MSTVGGLFWQDEGSGSGEDCFTIFEFQWLDNPPDQSTFEGLMKQAAVVIDDWIASRF